MIRAYYLTCTFALLLLAACTDTYDHTERHQIHGEHDYHDHSDHDHETEPADDGFTERVEEYERRDRVIWQKPGIVIDQLGDLSGKTVADIGAGSGYFSFRLMSAADRVIAIDIDPASIAYIDSIRQLPSVPEELRRHLEPRLGAEDDPNLQPEEVDAVIVVNTYAYIDDRVAYFKKVHRAMRPGSRLLVVDFKMKNLPLGHAPDPAYRVAMSKVEQELSAAGFTGLRTDDTTLDYQYIVTAERGE